MKKKLLGIFLPLLAGVAVIGSGFSVWYFVEGGQATATLDIEADLEGYAQIGSLAIKDYSEPDTVTLHLDSTKEKEDKRGINLFKGETKFNDIDLTYSLSQSQESLTLDRAPVLTVKVALPGGADTAQGLDDYVKVELATGESGAVSGWTSSSASENNNTVYTFTSALGLPTYSQSPSGSAQSVDIDMPSFVFSYQNNEPQNPSDWEALNAAIPTGTSIDIDYSLTWSEI